MVAQMVKNLPAMQETWVQSFGQEDTLEKGMATHSVILAWRIPWMEEFEELQSMNRKESDMTERLTHIHTEMEIAELAQDRLLRVTTGCTNQHHVW